MKKGRRPNRKQRRVLVLMLSSHQHLEMIETTATVARIDDMTFVADLVQIEKQARERLEGQVWGAWNDTADMFEMIAVLSGTMANNPLEHGRVCLVKQVASTAVANWREANETPERTVAGVHHQPHDAADSEDPA